MQSRVHPLQIAPQSAAKLETGTFAMFIFTRVDICLVQIFMSKCFIEKESYALQLSTP